MEPAPRLDRLYAKLIDGALLAAPAVLFSENLGTGPAMLGSGLFLVVLGCQIRLLWRDGQTVGKRLRGLRIVADADGSNGGFVANVRLRTVLNDALSVFPLYALVDVLLIFRGDRRCAHDLIAGTRVVRAGPGR